MNKKENENKTQTLSQFVKYPIQVLLQPQETKTFIEQSILIQTTLNFEL